MVLDDSEILIEKITYTASLVTHTSAVDPYLDRMRAITSRVGFMPANMSDSDRKVLADIQDKLEAYLTEKEQLRSFTRQSLEVQIEQHFAGDTKTKQLRLKTAAILTAAAIGAILTTMSPIFASNTLEHTIFTGAITSALMNAGATWLFVSALPAFKSDLRRAFSLLCSGMILFGLALLLEPYVELWDIQRNSSDLATFTVMPIIASSVVLMYISVIHYAKLADVVSRPYEKLFPVAVAILALLVGFIPGSHNSSKLAIDLSVFLHGLLIMLAIGIVTVLNQTTRMVADLYKPPLYALLQAIIVLVIATVIFIGIVASAGPHLTNTDSALLFILLCTVGGMLIRAGYKFNQVSRY